MSDKFQPIQAFANNQIEAMAAAAGVFARGAEKIFAETKDFQVTTLQNNSAWISKLVSARTMSDVIQAQTEHVKAHYDASVGETKKIGEILTDLTRDAVKSVLSGASQKSSAIAVPGKSSVTQTRARAEQEAA